LVSQTRGLKKSWWRSRMLNSGGIQARSFYRRIGTLPIGDTNLVGKPNGKLGYLPAKGVPKCPLLNFTAVRFSTFPNRGNVGKSDISKNF